VHRGAVVGFSDGGILGLMLAVRHPQRVRPLVISGVNISPTETELSLALLSKIEQPDWLNPIISAFLQRPEGAAAVAHWRRTLTSMNK
jgi:pimeloyl-ACP methyl ester carboxylesterase